MDQSQLYELYDREPGPIVAFLEYLRALYDLPRPGTILDMGCGPGRLLAPLTAASWAVVGYEPDPDYAAAARKTLSGLRDGRFRQAGFLELDEIEAFDLIAAVNGPYYYLITPRERREALERCATALRPGGLLFLEFSNFYWILKNYREPPAVELDLEGTKVRRVAHHAIDYHRGTLSHTDRFTWRDHSDAEQVLTKTHRMALVSYPELAYFLDELGFEQVLTFNSYDDREPSELTGRRVLVAARRPSGRGPRHVPP